MAMNPEEWLTVRAVEGRRITRHDAPERAIEGEERVRRHTHYLRAIARGDLELVETKKQSAKKSAEVKEG